ncbi:MAG TPA: hypothetical protein VF613_15105 [Longimicrobium sp.]|jgi:hypothetical protein
MLERSALQHSQVVGVGDGDEGVGALAEIFAVEVGDAPLGDDVVDVGTGVATPAPGRRRATMRDSPRRVVEGRAIGSRIRRG